MENKFDEVLLSSWKSEQEILKSKLILEDAYSWQEERSLSSIAGVDLSFIKEDSDKACCALVVCTWPDLNVVYKDCQMVTMTTPYIPGFLGFRETEHILNNWERMAEKVECLPDVLIVDGNGLLHSREFGLACHVGVALNMPTIGAAKNLYQMEGLLRDEAHHSQIHNLKEKGNSFPLFNNEGKCLGKALKTTAESKKPMYVSVGNLISLETACWLVSTSSKYRVPEPVRQADIISREYIRDNFSIT